MDFKNISEENKRKIITYSILGLIILVFLIWVIKDIKSDKNSSKRDDIEYPESIPG